jgi:ribonuclease HIII
MRGHQDYFGPLVVVACYLTPSSERALRALGLGASSPLPNKIPRLRVRELGNLCPHELVSIGPERYNQLLTKLGSQEALLTWSHAKALQILLSAYPSCNQVILPESFQEEALRTRLKGVGEELHFLPLSSCEQDPSHLSAKILARSNYRRQLRKLSEEIGVALPEGNDRVLPVARKLYSRGGRQLMQKVAKLHFETTGRLG